MKKKKLITVHNPLLEDFSVKWGASDKKSKTLTILMGDYKEFEESEADHISKHLCDKILITKGWAGSNPEEKRKEIMKIILPTI